MLEFTPLHSRGSFRGMPHSMWISRKLLIHVTPVWNWYPIASAGLICGEPRAHKAKRVWLADVVVRDWLFPHIADHHSTRQSYLVCFAVRWAALMLRRGSKLGTWWVTEDIPRSALIPLETESDVKGIQTS
jgi:hypothetical protein